MDEDDGEEQQKAEAVEAQVHEIRQLVPPYRSVHDMNRGGGEFGSTNESDWLTRNHVPSINWSSLIRIGVHAPSSVDGIGTRAAHDVD